MKGENVTDIDSVAQALLRANQLKGMVDNIEEQVYRRFLEAARENGLSVRQTAAFVGLPKSTVARDLRRRSDDTTLPRWAGPSDTFRTLWNEVWSHEPAERVGPTPTIPAALDAALVQAGVLPPIERDHQTEIP